MKIHRLDVAASSSTAICEGYVSGRRKLQSGIQAAQNPTTMPSSSMCGLSSHSPLFDGLERVGLIRN
jgi:hypothetical protein